MVPKNSTKAVSIDAGAIALLSAGLVSILGNLLAMTAIMFNPRYRKTSLAILCHHCFLDLLKSLYCLPYGYSLYMDVEIPQCHVIGSSYVFIMTTSSYNMLALVVNEEYSLTRNACSSSRETTWKHSDGNCIFFGIFIIWFMSLLLNLGVAIIPSNTTYIPEIGNCIFLYGVPDGFVLHVLWVTLVTMAIVLALTSFFRMYRRISLLTKEAKWSHIHRSLSGEVERDSTDDSYMDDCNRNHHIRKSHLQLHMRRVLIFISMVTTFALFWYPLFFLTIFDPSFKEPSIMYKVLTIIAWCQPITTPVFSGIILRDVRLRESVLKEISSNTIPLLLTTSDRSNEPTERNDTRGDNSFDVGISDYAEQNEIRENYSHMCDLGANVDGLGIYNSEFEMVQETGSIITSLSQGDAISTEFSPRRTQAYRMSQV